MPTRSYQGCWTCKRRRRRCDNTRPTCQSCARHGMSCEGYEVRLRWGSGIASRGKYTGADKPLEESVPPRLKGRARDLKRDRKAPTSQGEIQGSFILPFTRYWGTQLTSLLLGEFDWKIPGSRESLSSEGEKEKEEEAIFNECESCIFPGKLK